MKFTTLLFAFAALFCATEAAKGPKVTNKVYFDVTHNGKVSIVPNLFNCFTGISNHKMFCPYLSFRISYLY